MLHVNYVAYKTYNLISLQIGFILMSQRTPYCYEAGSVACPKNHGVLCFSMPRASVLGGSGKGRGSSGLAWHLGLCIWVPSSRLHVHANGLPLLPHLCWWLLGTPAFTSLGYLQATETRGILLLILKWPMSAVNHVKSRIFHHLVRNKTMFYKFF